MYIERNSSLNIYISNNSMSFTAWKGGLWVVDRVVEQVQLTAQDLDDELRVQLKKLQLSGMYVCMCVLPTQKHSKLACYSLLRYPK